MAKKKKLPTWATTVTPFSKLLALSMLVVFPVLGFYYGMYYQKQMDVVKLPKKEVIVYKNVCSQPQDGKVTCETDSDCPANYTCAQAGPIRSDGNNHKTCWKKGDAMPL
jgi:hypothetical protein